MYIQNQQNVGIVMSQILIHIMPSTFLETTATQQMLQLHVSSFFVQIVGIVEKTANYKAVIY